MTVFLVHAHIHVHVRVHVCVFVRIRVRFRVSIRVHVHVYVQYIVVSMFFQALRAVFFTELLRIPRSKN
jgi:hypothetical protein